MKKVLFLLFIFFGTNEMKAQIDPTLAGMIYVYTDKAKDELNAQKRAMLLETTGHLWLKEEVEGTTDIQKKFNSIK